MRGHDVAGATVTVVADGDTVLTKGVGHAYRNPDAPVDPATTLFRIGSVSKVFPFVAAMRLVDAGRVDPHAPVQEHLESVSVPDTEAYDEPVTLAHLATHTSGFETRSAGQFRRSLDDIRPLPEALRANDPERVRPPGELPSYTNYNAGLAGQLVADVHGTGFARAIRQLVFEPLEMASSTFDPLPAALVGGRSDAAEEITWYSEMTPASGLSATATDMARFIRALVSDGSFDGRRVLSPESLAALHRQWYTPHDRLAGAAFGLKRQRRGETLVVGHGGAVPDFKTDLRLLPREGVGLFVSVHGAEADEVQQAVTDAFLDHVAPVAEPTGTQDPPTRGSDLSGTYRSTAVTDAESFEKAVLATRPSLTVRIADTGDLVTERGGTTHRWTEVAPLVFRRVDGTDTLVFRESDDEIRYLFRASAPLDSFESVPWSGQLGVHSQLALGAGLVTLSGAVGWPVAALWRRYRSQSDVPRCVTRSRWLAGGSMLAFIAFLVVGLYGVTRRWLYARPPWVEFLFGVPTVGALLAVGAAGFVANAWRQDQGSRLARVHVTAVVVGLLVLSWVLWYWNLLQLLPW
jgi:CubicO group peptidase (beta-lactamase class C family)